MGEKIGMSDMEEQFKLLEDKVNNALTTLIKQIALLETEIKTLRTAKPSVSDAYSKPDFHSSSLDVMKPPSDQDTYPCGDYYGWEWSLGTAPGFAPSGGPSGRGREFTPDH